MPRPSNLSRDTASDRPPIWVDGQQQPKFAFGPWVTVGHAMARTWVVPQLAMGAQRLSVLGGQIAAGRFAMNLSRLGKVQNFLPTRQTVGRGVAGLGQRLSDAGLILQPVAAAPEPIAFPDLVRAKAAQDFATVSPPAAPLPRTTEVEPTLSAIRAVLRGLPEVEPAPLARATPHVADLPRKAADPGPHGQLFTRILSHFIAWSALALAMPVGLTQAALLHLNGGDLADWD